LGKRIQCLDHESVSIQIESASAVFNGVPPSLPLEAGPTTLYPIAP
jgi:hypothetical protein